MKLGIIGLAIIWTTTASVGHADDNGDVFDDVEHFTKSIKLKIRQTTIDKNAIEKPAALQYVHPEGTASDSYAIDVGSSRVDLQACKLEYSIVSPK